MFNQENISPYSTWHVTCLSVSCQARWETSIGASALPTLFWSQALQLTVNLTAFVISSIFAGFLLLITHWLHSITWANPPWNNNPCITGHNMIFKPFLRLFVFQIFSPSAELFTKLIKLIGKGKREETMKGPIFNS